MSIVILGGNERMTRRYADICQEYSCKAKVYPKMSSGALDIGRPDLVIFFIDTVSHKLVKRVMQDIGENTAVARCHTGSVSALRRVLEEHTKDSAKAAG